MQFHHHATMQSSSSCDRQSGELGHRPACLPGQCELFGEGEGGEREGPISGIGYYSGNQACRKTVIGENSGCFQADQAYNEASKIDQFTTDPADKTNWGDCALRCNKTNGCKFWSLATSLCTNCQPGTCLMYGEDAEVTPNKAGYIAGEVDCQDILFSPDLGLTLNVQDESKIRNILVSSDAESKPGKCLNPNRNRPKCPAQEVPGYRCVIFLNWCAMVMHRVNSDT